MHAWPWLRRGKTWGRMCIPRGRTASSREGTSDPGRNANAAKSRLIREARRTPNRPPERLEDGPSDGWLSTVIDSVRDFRPMMFKKAGFSVLFINNIEHCDHYHADIVLNQNLHADASLYRRQNPPRGSCWDRLHIVAEEEFLAYRDHERLIPDVARRVLHLPLGGSDPEDITGNVIRALDLVDVQKGIVTAVVVVGNSYGHLESLHGTIAPPACGSSCWWTSLTWRRTRYPRGCRRHGRW